MKKTKIIISVLLILSILLTTCSEVFAATVELDVKFDGKNIAMESETQDMNWNLDNFLPGSSDTSSITITNKGEKTAIVETSINIEEDTGLVEAINLEVTNKDGEVVYTGKYTELETIQEEFKPEEYQTYTVKTSLDASAGNEYQNKQYKLKFSFKAIGNVPFGTLTVRHVDENNDLIEPETVETKKINSPDYNVSAKNFDGYRFVSVDGPTQGPYKEEGVIVTFHYEKVYYGNLIVKYVDKESGEILEQTSTKKEVGENYKLNSTGKNFAGYKFESIEGNLEGEITSEDTIITYYYNKIKYGTVTVKWVDEDSKKILEQEVEKKEVGSSYSYELVGKEIKGYDFTKVEGKTSGNYIEGNIDIVYYYKKKIDVQPEIKQGRLIKKYVDQDDKVIQAEATTEDVGKEYSVDVVGKDIPGYKFVEFIGESEGFYKEEDTIVTYKYKKIDNGKVIIVYVDENESELEREVVTGIVDDPYRFVEDDVKKDIPGYEFKEIDGSLTGEYKKEDTIIYCRYKKIKYGRVIVVCMDENNEVIKRTITTEKVGTDYNLGKVGEEIEGFIFLGVEGETEGKYKEEDTIVIYRYKHKKPEGPSTEEITLPQTGQFIYFYIILGVIIFILLLLLLLLKRRKKDDEEDKANN